jgi:hypothetical protein
MGFLVAEGDIRTIPVSPEAVARARFGDWSVVLTLNKLVPAFSTHLLRIGGLIIVKN